ncbi:DNA polymerase III subunit delta [Candidatus Erwinia haradaeae]|uniref:DNA polymerase III subunit delta n=1 Tax=Candidatus Erwinia haradaeae TaxID=1922217 RepID=A0A451D475_9GAMM|nr:DNA polymerase III subunit delta [Candidatus Erwinia haradaeae]VFP80428.1 DNA polymerase III subunit delta [Candidatus Erwinia haradaeae]
MQKIYPEQLDAQLTKSLKTCYMLVGNEPFLLEETKNIIHAAAQKQGFTAYLKIELNNKTDWQNIFTICQSFSLFKTRQIFLLIFPDCDLNSFINTQLVQLSHCMHTDILLILQASSFSKKQKNTIWYNNLSVNAVEVSCHTMECEKLSLWVSSRAKNLNLKINDEVQQLLCYSYEGNLLELSKVLEQALILWPNIQITTKHIKKIIHNSAHFTIFHWLHSVLAGDGKRAIYVLHKISSENTEPIILLRILQRDLILLLIIKRKITNTPLHTILNQHRIYQQHRTYLILAVQRLANIDFLCIYHLMSKIELKLKKNFNQAVWLEIEILTMVLCGFRHPLHINVNSL